MSRIPKFLQTPRLTLKPFRPKDAREVNHAVLESFRELHRWMSWAKRKPTLAQSRVFCGKAARDFAARREFPFLTRRKTNGELIGAAVLVRGDRTVPKFEIGYWVRTPLTGQGYATEAVRALVRFARRHLRVRRLEIRTDARNTRSAAVAKRAGFKLEAVLRHDARDHRGRLRNTQIFAKLF